MSSSNEMTSMTNLFAKTFNSMRKRETQIFRLIAKIGKNGQFSNTREPNIDFQHMQTVAIQKQHTGIRYDEDRLYDVNCILFSYFSHIQMHTNTLKQFPEIILEI